MFGVNGLAFSGGVFTCLNSSECIMADDALPPILGFLSSKKIVNRLGTETDQAIEKKFKNFELLLTIVTVHNFDTWEQISLPRSSQSPP